MSWTRLGSSLVVLVLGGSWVGCGGDVGEPGQGTNASRSSGAEGDDEAEPAPASGKMKLGENGCAADDECESGVCFKGNSQSFCTVRCTTDDATTTCVPPLTGTCNKQGFCKRN
ncbi:MAG: hypothetical protein KIS78_17260 [Labilithrix sp.]|nr:hypothetical protein [Labilithrix sp.]MCW5834150.1 hypothetical protein [Labilithrix sp.]